MQVGSSSGQNSEWLSIYDLTRPAVIPSMNRAAENETRARRQYDGNAGREHFAPVGGVLAGQVVDSRSRDVFFILQKRDGYYKFIPGISPT